MGEPDSLVTASAALNAFHVPVVAVNPGFYSGAGGQVVKLYSGRLVISKVREKTETTRTNLPKTQC